MIRAEAKPVVARAVVGQCDRETCVVRCRAVQGRILHCIIEVGVFVGDDADDRLMIYYYSQEKLSLRW